MNNLYLRIHFLFPLAKPLQDFLLEDHLDQNGEQLVTWLYPNALRPTDTQLLAVTPAQIAATQQALLAAQTVFKEALDIAITAPTAANIIKVFQEWRKQIS